MGLSVDRGGRMIYPEVWMIVEPSGELEPTKSDMGSGALESNNGEPCT